MKNLNTDHVHKFSELEVNTIREWFEVVQDLANKKYLEKRDYVLAERVYQVLKMRVPHSILKGKAHGNKVKQNNA